MGLIVKRKDHPVLGIYIYISLCLSISCVTHLGLCQKASTSVIGEFAPGINIRISPKARDDS